MEEIKTATAAATAAPEAEEPVVVIMGDGPAPEAMRKAFPNADFIDTSETAENEDDTLRQVAHARFASVAYDYRLAFTTEEHEALFKLSRVFSPAVAVEAAHAACRAFLGDWRR